MSPSSPAASPPDVGILLAAAGRGERAGAGEPKQFRPIGGVPMLLRAIRPFAQHPRVCQIVVALPAEHAAAPPSWLSEVVGGRLCLVAGGTTRAASVHAALGALPQECSLVLVHDAARPFVSPETIDAVIAAAGTGAAVVPAVPVSDTLKRTAEGDPHVLETVERAGLWRAQTPQGFPRGMLEEAFRGAERSGDWGFTDEAALVEAAGHPVVVVPDHSSNIKVTTAEDLALAEAILAS
jgi:2-C-methyl-D-erythritol 4-phosphate cytidylyltransferase